MKRFLSLALASVMLLAAGCGQASVPSGSNTPTPTAKASDSPSATPEALEPITLTMYSVETNAYPDNYESPVAQKIKELTGVTLEVEFAISQDAGKEKLSLMAASGDYPDLVYAKGDLNILKNVNGVLKLDELIEQYGPNIQKFYSYEDAYKRLRWSLEDPSIYYIGGKELGQENSEPNAGMQISLGAIKEQNYPLPKTLEDVEAIVKEYVAKHPTTADGQKTIGLSLCGDDWLTMITVTNPANFALGNSDDGEWYVNNDTLEVTRHVTRPETKEYFRWLNHMNDIGLLDPESFIQKEDQYKAKIASGRVVALTDARWHLDEPVRALKQANNYDATYGFYPVTLKEEYKFADFQSTGYLGGYALSLTSTNKDPVRTIQFLDWMCTEEAQILINWGIEGEHYDVVDGKRVLRPEIKEMYNSDPAFQQKTGIRAYRYPFPAYGNRVTDSTGQYYEAFITQEEVLARQSDIENEVLAKYGVKSWKELYPQAEDFPIKSYGAAWLVNIDDPDWKAADDKILRTGYSMIAAAVMAKPAEFDQKWDEYMKALDTAGLDWVTEQFEKTLKDRTELWK